MPHVYQIKLKHGHSYAKEQGKQWNIFKSKLSPTR